LQDGEIKVLRQLGFGGLSAIYLVQYKKNELAILKESVLPADVDDQLKAKAEEQFDREARILAGLKHPRIARVLDHFVEKGHYLLLEYVHGQDLRQYVNELGVQSERVVLAFALQIAEILKYLHSREPAIIHRDLTPENLIVNDKNRIVLIDFGAANEFLHTATGTLVGKHAYMAPEQLKGKAQTASDLYAMGCTMHFLLTGQDPVPLSSSHPTSINNTVPAEMDELVFRLTQFDPSARFSSAAEVLDKIKSMLKQSAGA
jgi:serine/threonine-protein kinase